MPARDRCAGTAPNSHHRSGQRLLSTFVAGPPHALTRRIRRIFTGFLVLLLVLASVEMIPALTSRNRAEALYDRWIPARADTLRLVTALVDQETGERGFVITGDPIFLEPFSRGRAVSRRLIGRLTRTLGSDQKGRALVRATAARYTTWRTQVAEPVIAAARGPNPEAAQATIASGIGRRLFSGVRKSTTNLTSYLDRRVREAQQAITDANDTLVLTLLATLGAIAALAAFARRWLRQWSNRLEAQLAVEEQLATQTALLDRITTGIPDPIFLKDADGRYVFLNPAAARVMGGDDPRDYIGRSDSELLSEDDVAAITAADERVRSSAVALSLEEQVGDRLYLSTKSPYVFSDGSRGVLGVAQEITLRKREENRLASIAQVTRAIASETTVADVAIAARDPLRAATDADVIWILIADDLGRALDVVLDDGTLAATGRDWGSNPTDGPTMTAEAFRTGEIRIVSSSDASPDSVGREIFDRERLVTVMHIPFPAGSRIAGVVNLGWRHDHAETAREEQHFFASLVAAVVESLARAQSNELQQQAVAAFQRALLRDDVFPSDVEIAVRYEPAIENLDVGGDWYDVFELADDRLGIVVGDVVGSGVGAAAVMGQLKSALKALATIVGDPAEVLNLVDGYAEHEPAAVATTVCYGVLDRTTRVLRYACAGHPAPLLVSADGTAHLLEDGRSFPIGASWHGSAHPRVSGEVTLAENAVLVLYTDGLIERRDRSLDAGFEALRSAGATHHALPIEELADTLLDRLDPNHRTDDTAMMCLRIPSRPAQHLTRRIPADVNRLRGLRADVRAWLGDQGLDAATIEDVILATFEAAANAVEHGSHADGRSQVIVELSLRDDLYVTVRDRGRWTAQVRRPERGRGQEIMRSVMDSVLIETDRRGTVVHMRRRVSPTAQTA